MRKTNLNLKRVAFFKKLAIVLVIHAVFASICIWGICSGMPIDASELKPTTITVKEVVYKRKPFSRNYMFRITASDGVEYGLPLYGGADHEYSWKEMYETIRPGDTLRISYLEQEAVISRANVRSIYVIGNETTQFRSWESYNEYRDMQTVTGIIICSIAEFVFLICFTFFVVRNLSELKFFQHRKRKKKTKNSPTQK